MNNGITASVKDLRDFVQEIAETAAGGMLNGNQLSMRAAELLASHASQQEQPPETIPFDVPRYAFTPNGNDPRLGESLRHVSGAGEWINYHELMRSAWMAYIVRAAAPTALATPDQHADDLAVDRFAAAMKAKLAVARAKGRGGWEDKTECTQTELSDMLRAHIEKGDPRDVANFCMFLHQRGELIVAQTPECAEPEPTINLDAISWANIQQAARESKWIPPEYFANDWVSDVCEYLREGHPNDDQIAAAKRVQAALLPEQGVEPERVTWPKTRDVGRHEDMSTTGVLRITLDDDGDASVCVSEAHNIASVEFCTQGNGGGKSPRTRDALIALMVAIEADNASDPDRGFWERRALAAQQKGCGQ